MGKFLDAERIRQADFKATSPYFSEAARADGIYRGEPRPFCLPHDCAQENLFAEIRNTSVPYFVAQGIKWHDGGDRRPSNHLCGSQVCCVNFLFPFADKPRSLAEFLRPIFPAVREMLPMEGDQFVAFEWIGQENYLGEEISRSGKRTRGANFTSADAAVMFERNDGLRQIVLIEWKYTESYSTTSLEVSRNGTDRKSIYAHLFHRDDCPLNRDILPDFGVLFFEPFYQFMRQQLLAHEMERSCELGADVVSVLHIAPAHNLDFRKVTSPALRSLGDSAVDVWKKLVRMPDRFISVSTEDLFGDFRVENFPKLVAWGKYISARYAWIC